MTEHPVLVIGLDGATFDILRPWANEGILPNLRQLMDTGITAPLYSTIPPITGPAWSSFATGKHPGKHGNIDFYLKGDNYSLRPINAQTIQAQTLWEILSKAGKRVCVINVPVTYPPKPVNGLMVSGMLTPSTNSTFTYPPDLKNEILSEWPDYSFAVPWRDYEGIGIEDLLKDLRYVTKQRRDLVFHYLKREKWDFFMAVFVGMDRVQHCLWRLMDPKHPAYEENLAARYLPLIQDYYTFIDEIVGSIISDAPKQTNVILMSDHGFGPLWKEVDLNRWLAGEKLLTYHSRWQGIVGRTWHKGRRLARTIPFLQKAFKAGYGKKLKQRVWEATFSSAVDWAKTCAYCHAHGGLFVNLAGREPQGIVQQDEYEALRDELIERLQNMLDPETGQRIIYRAQRIEEVYSGAALNLAPDVIVTEADERYYLGFISTPNLRFIEETRWKSGYHRYDGVFIANGFSFRTDWNLEKASIVDLMPTILYLLNLPVPNDVDGRILDNLFSDEYLVNQPPIYYEVDHADAIADGYLDKEAENLLIERLRSLGYL